MPVSWTNIRIPVELHGRLRRLAVEYGRSLMNCDPPQFMPKVPDDIAERESIPLWFIIEKAVREFEDHRRRSRYKNRKQPKTAP
jgi:predicted transcriptional regulator